MKKFSAVIFLTLLCAFSANAQLEYIHNITVSQRADATGLVDVNFDLVATPRSYYIYMEVSFDSGVNFSPIMSNYTTGDTGPLAPGTGYHIVWDGLGSFPDIYSTQSQLKVMASVCPTQTIYDADSNVYFTVGIGDQCWMKENLNRGTMVPGNENQLFNFTVEKYCYDNDSNNCNIYGGLYQWDEAMYYTTAPGTQGICPTGWHIPTDAEWTTLTTYLGGESVAGGKMKEAGLAHWSSPNAGATNSSGFTALPGGTTDYFGDFQSLTSGAYIWSSLEASSNGAWHLYLHYNYNNVVSDGYTKTRGLSVRCLLN